MKSKVVAMAIVVLMVCSVGTPSVLAVGASQAGASLLLPTTGQAMNGEIKSTKAKVMAGIEIAGITTLAILGGLVGGGVTWAAIGPLLANHIWSATDAYQSAQKPGNSLAQQQMMGAQNTLDLSRQARFEREQVSRSDIRDRILMAGEAARYS